MLAAGCCATLATSSVDPARIEDEHTVRLHDLETTRVRVRLNAAAREHAAAWVVHLSTVSEQEGKLTIVSESGPLAATAETQLVLSHPATDLNAAGSMAQIDTDDSGTEDSGTAGAAAAAGSAFARAELRLDLTACPDHRPCEVELRIVSSGDFTGGVSVNIRSSAHRALEEGGCLSMGPTAPDFSPEAEIEVLVDE